MVENADVGSPWAGDAYGAVVSPARTRAYLTARAAHLAGRRSSRWAVELAHGKVAAVQGRRPGARGRESWFLDAEEFEELGVQEGWWPPRAELLVDHVVREEELRALEAENVRLRHRVRDLEEQTMVLQADVRQLTAECEGHVDTIQRMRPTRSSS